jgi:hypothetical protein
MYPDRIGTISVKPTVPTWLTIAQKEPSGMASPPSGSGWPPRATDSAISSPPTTTNGIM